MLFHDSKDESAIGLALMGFLMVVMAAVLGNMTGDVQPKAPIERSHPEASSPYLQERSPAKTPREPGNSSPYPQPGK